MYIDETSIKKKEKKSQCWSNQRDNSDHGQTCNINVRVEEVVVKLGIDETVGEDRLQGQNLGRSRISWQAGTEAGWGM